MTPATLASDSIAVVLTCHNRREATLSCIRGLIAQKLDTGCALQVFLVDDGSTDGTAEAVANLLPQVSIIRGNGSLFWSGGMRAGIAAAMASDAAFILWLNDDTVLDPYAVAGLLTTWRKESDSGRNETIVVGTTQSASGEATYGGVRSTSRINPLRYSLVIPDRESALSCDTMNGNCVLMHRTTISRGGNIYPGYVHAAGDFDFGFQARKRGVRLVVAPGFVGTCNRNPVRGTWKDDALPFAKRWRNLTGIKALPPKAWFHFCRRNAGLLWPLVFVSPYLKLAVSALKRRQRAESAA
jgi:GT2 family glycosyltransferase